jgi:hypothetical protein|tara:strand:+ start:378 stop:560 length:183 start_codon:yes stop_codon:yes gene_type:complete
MDNLNLINDLKDKNDEIKKLKSIILELYGIIKYTNEYQDIKLINLIAGIYTLLMKELDLI